MVQIAINRCKSFTQYLGTTRLAYSRPGRHILVHPYIVVTACYPHNFKQFSFQRNAVCTHDLLMDMSSAKGLWSNTATSPPLCILPKFPKLAMEIRERFICHQPENLPRLTKSGRFLLRINHGDTSDQTCSSVSCCQTKKTKR